VTYAANIATITAVFQNIAGDVNNQSLTLTGDFSQPTATWAWGGTVPSTYIPKGS
jgi:hypothetical protein